MTAAEAYVHRVRSTEISDLEDRAIKSVRDRAKTFVPASEDGYDNFVDYVTAFFGEDLIACGVDVDKNDNVSTGGALLRFGDFILVASNEFGRDDSDMFLAAKKSRSGSKELEESCVNFFIQFFIGGSHNSWVTGGSEPAVRLFRTHVVARKFTANDGDDYIRVGRSIACQIENQAKTRGLMQ